ncbi:16S rRNA (uracil(1498)-N(3))-methyltransferase [Mycoplasmopsis caviae]|uniref:Ribosomal RNA small subunit methyltransferase E n=1 Tax=Mycoplasmopsis caviae TaxID=55603 RepID=A0A3P8MFD2_9BACT|nr:16S rRNA (uracil(1498)-N(3))-methyltransferase [Mycoplasmopsis caviae]UUD34712.1 16S rRNA (uracil(1498)-N(3))-methyltransferase [Mycoplasmopsis caviae]VDR42413.1 RsmE family RNA methyltransferase [Mycoplasmopsis caviae]
MHRFFVDKKIDNEHFELSVQILKHIKVARVENEEFICTYEGEFYKCKLKNKTAYIIEKLNLNNEFNKPLILAAPIIKIKRFEWILQKATELGVSTIIPFVSKYTDSKILKYEFNSKLERFGEIIKNAAEQSFRNIIPQLTTPMNLKQIVNAYPNESKYLAYENLQNESNNISYPTNSILIVGPEGGFSDEEIEFAQKNNIKITSLGKRILRAETACLYMLSNVKEN